MAQFAIVEQEPFGAMCDNRIGKHIIIPFKVGRRQRDVARLETVVALTYSCAINPLYGSGIREVKHLANKVDSVAMAAASPASKPIVLKTKAGVPVAVHRA